MFAAWQDDNREQFWAEKGSPRMYDFHRPSTPRPAALG